MAKQSDYTKVCRLKMWLFRALDWLFLFFPIGFYAVYALAIDGVGTWGKIAVISCVAIAAVLALFNVIAHKRLRCPVWIVLIGLYLAVQEILLPLIIIMAVATVLDDLVFTPLIEHYRSKLIANKAIDERLEDGGDIARAQ